MVTAAVDLTHLTKLEPPSLVVSAPGVEADGPSFQQHLEQAEKRASGDARPQPEVRSSEPTNETSSKSLQRADEADENGPRDRTSKAEEDEKPVVDEADPNVEQRDEETCDEQVRATDAQVAAVAIVQIVATEKTQTVVADDEPRPMDGVAMERFGGKPNADFAPAATTKPELVIETPSPTTENGATVEVVNAEIAADSDPFTLRPTSPLYPEQNKQAKPVGDEKSTKNPSSDSAKPIEATETIETIAQVVAQTTATTVVTEVPAAEMSDDGNDFDGKNEAKTERSETMADPTAAPASQTSASDANTASATAIAESIADRPVTSGEDKPSKSKEPHGGTISAVDGKSEPTTDRATGNESPPRPTQPRDVAIVRTDGGESMRTLSHADRVRLVQRVARAVQTAQDRGGDLKIRLSPPELGSLRLQVRLNDGVLSARIEADNSSARQVLVENLPQLRERLAEQNIRIEKFDIDLFNSGGGASQTPQQPFSQGDASHRASSSRREASRVSSGVETSAGKTTTPTVADGRLNVVV